MAVSDSAQDRYEAAKSRFVAALSQPLPEKAKARPSRAAPSGAGMGADGPAKEKPVKGARDLSFASWREVIKRVFASISKDRVMSVAGGVTFFGLLALFPAITALVSIYGLFADPNTINTHLGLLSEVLPADVTSIVSDQINRIASSSSTALSFAGFTALAVALYSANGGTKALIEALNVAWFVTEKRGFIRLNLVALAFTLSAIVLIFLMVGIIAVIPVILAYIPLPLSTERIVSFVRWPILFAVLTFALACLYRFGPAVEKPRWHWITPGAFFAVIGLVGSSMLFSWYVSNFGNYNKTYGSLSAVVVLMMWLWITSMVVMVGAEINSEVERQIAKENGAPLPEEEPSR